MRIAYLVNHYPKVSHSFIRREILALERRGFEVVRIALRGWDNEILDEEDLLERKRTRYVQRNGSVALLIALARTLLTRPAPLLRALVVACRMGTCAERPLFVHLIYLAEACRIGSWLRNAGVRHLHAHFGTNSAEIAMLVHLLGGPDWSFTVHGPEEFDKAQIIGLGEKIRRCSFVVAISSYGRSQLYRCVEHKCWPKVRVVHCGLESEYFAGSVVSVPKTRRLVCVGRLCEQKGQLILIEATHQLLVHGVTFELVLAGDGDMRGAIEELIQRRNLEGKVRITGWITGEQVRNEILAARALVLPSLAEGLPVVIMEAMALRRPIISTYVGGIPELVEDGKHGWLVPAGDVSTLMRVMRACLDTPADKLSQMGQAARERVHCLHNADTEAAKLAKCFRSATGSRLKKDVSLD